MDSQHPTIYDVARVAGVSITTVSRVLNSPQKVRGKTRERILKAIEELHFVPKAEASARARKEYGRIGVLTPFFTRPSFVQRMRGVAAALSDTDYELIVYTVESPAQLAEYMDMLPVSRRIDGLIIISLPVNDESAQRIMDNNLQTVLIEYNQPAFSSIEIDNEGGGELAAGYLLNKGYRRCAFIGESGEPAYSLHGSDMRLMGFRKTLEKAGLSLPETYIKKNPIDTELTIRQTRELMALPEPPEAIFTISDILAAGVLKAARQMGLRVPEDLAIIGFDDIDLADYLALTTINQSLDDSGRTAVELLLARMNDPARPVQKVQIQLNIVERSTA